MMKFLDHLEEWLITFLIGGATLIIFFAVVHRYGMGVDILQPWLVDIHTSWAQELCIIMFVWMAKFGAAYGVRTGIHVGVDVLINRMKDRNRARFVIFGLVAGALFTGVVAVLGANFVWGNGMHYATFHFLGIATGDLPEGPTTPDLEWPTWVVYLAIPLGSSLMCFRFLQVMTMFMRTGELPRHDHAHVAGVEDEAAQAEKSPQDINPKDINWFQMQDGLHPQPMTRGDEGTGKERQP
jgi:C4-dicarboxylate transporter DctQ subunit